MCHLFHGEISGCGNSNYMIKAMYLKKNVFHRLNKFQFSLKFSTFLREWNILLIRLRLFIIHFRFRFKGVEIWIVKFVEVNIVCTLKLRIKLMTTIVLISVKQYGHLCSLKSIAKAIYFLTRSLKQSIFGLLIPKPNVKWSFASYTLIFVKKYPAGQNTSGTRIELGEPKLDKN